MTFDQWWADNRFTDMMAGVDRDQALCIWNNATKTANAISTIVSGKAKQEEVKGEIKSV